MVDKLRGRKIEVLVPSDPRVVEDEEYCEGCLTCEAQSAGTKESLHEKELNYDYDRLCRRSWEQGFREDL